MSDTEPPSSATRQRTVAILFVIFGLAFIVLVGWAVRNAIAAKNARMAEVTMNIPPGSGETYRALLRSRVIIQRVSQDPSVAKLLVGQPSGAAALAYLKERLGVELLPDGTKLRLSFDGPDAESSDAILVGFQQSILSFQSPPSGGQGSQATPEASAETVR